MKKSFFEQIILYDYRYILGYAALVVICVYGLFWRLGTLLPGLSAYEADYLNRFNQAAGTGLGDNPLFWPHKLLTDASLRLLGPSELAVRLPSALLALAGLVLFFFVIRHRFKSQVAIVGVLLLGTSSWWLAGARLARPEIMIPVVMLLITFLSRLVLERHRTVWLILLAIALGISFYVPLMPYVIVVAAAISYSLIRRAAKEFTVGGKIGFVVLLAASVVPLLMAIYNEPEVGRNLLALPDEWPSLGTYLQNLKELVASIFWSAKEFTPLNLGTLPYLDIFTVAMFTLGFYYLDHEISRSLTQFLIFGLAALLLLLSFNPQPGYSMLLIPFIYTLTAAGIVMLFSQWYEIFPKNPIARMAVFLPTILLLSVVVWYHHTRYFTAAPKNPQTVETFSPLSPALYDFAANHTKGQKAVILTTEAEMTIALAVAKTYPNLQITSVASAAIGQPNLAITHQAFEAMDSDSRRQARRVELTPYNSPYNSLPIILWYTTAD